MGGQNSTYTTNENLPHKQAKYLPGLCGRFSLLVYVLFCPIMGTIHKMGIIHKIMKSLVFALNLSMYCQ